MFSCKHRRNVPRIRLLLVQAKSAGSEQVGISLLAHCAVSLSVSVLAASEMSSLAYELLYGASG